MSKLSKQLKDILEKIKAKVIGEISDTLKENSAELTRVEGEMKTAMDADESYSLVLHGDGLKAAYKIVAHAAKFGRDLSD